MGKSIVFYIVATLTFGACKKVDELPDETATDDVDGRYAGAVARLKSLEEGGWVVSRDAAGVRHAGDALIWTGLATGALPCAEAEEETAALAAMVTKNGGYLTRFEPLPAEYVNGREVSLDGALGYYWGLAKRIERCGLTDPERETFALHFAALTESNGWLYPGAAAISTGFDYVPAILAYRMGLRGSPHDDGLTALATQAAAVAGGIKLARELWRAGARQEEPPACFRIHLMLLSLDAVESLGVEVPKGAFCAASDTLGMATVDHFCGRPGLLSFLNQFEANRWEYAHQRCGEWEAPDGAEGLFTPGLDELLGLAEAYDL